MKKFMNNYLKATIGVWILALLVLILLYNWFNQDFDFLIVQSVSLTLVIFIPSLFWRNVIKSRAKYMNSSSMVVPDFSVVKHHYLQNKIGLSSEDVIKVLPHSFTVTNIDVKNNKIKVYDKPSVWTWFTGYIIEVKPEETVIVSFPLSSQVIGAEGKREKGVAQLVKCLSA